MAPNQDMENLHGLMAAITREIFEITLYMIMVPMFGTTSVNILENGEMGK